MKRKILLITYHYPPSMAVGGQRLANFARHLPMYGWQPCVLTIQDRYLDRVDPQRLSGLDHAMIYKTAKMPTVSDLYLALKKKLAHRSPKNPGGPGQQAPRQAPEEMKQTAGETLSEKLKRYIFSLILSLPDGERNWVIPALVRGLGIIRRERIDCILTSCPPFSVHLIGLALKLITGVRWIADFRDPWITGSKKRLYYTSELSMKIEGRLEKQVLRRADGVLANTGMLLRVLQQAHGEIDPLKFIHLPNGFDPQEFARYRGLQKYDRFTLAYAGSLYFGRSPDPVFKALHALMAERKLCRDDVRMKLVGHCEQIDGRPTTTAIHQYQLEGVVEVSPPIPYGEAMEIVARSHVALLLAPDQPFQIPAKVYDYLGTGTAILALAGEGATADMVRDTRAGEVFSPHDHDGIKAFIAAAAREGAARPETQPGQIRQPLDIRAIVQRLAVCCDAVCLRDSDYNKSRKAVFGDIE